MRMVDAKQEANVRYHSVIIYIHLLTIASKSFSFFLHDFNIQAAEHIIFDQLNNERTHFKRWTKSPKIKNNPKPDASHACRYKMYFFSFS